MYNVHILHFPSQLKKLLMQGGMFFFFLSFLRVPLAIPSPSITTKGEEPGKENTCWYLKAYRASKSRGVLPLPLIPGLSSESNPATMLSLCCGFPLPGTEWASQRSAECQC